jgi:predicted alpha/beta hydrolase family esterase
MTTVRGGKTAAGDRLLTGVPVLTLPGWLSSGPDHWQTRWERDHGFERVEQDDWFWPRRGDWMARLEEVLLGSAAPALLVAHSLGCQLVAAWAAQSRHRARVRAALLVAPPDTEREDMPPQLHTWQPIPRQPLPFPATVVASSNDPFCTLRRSETLAAGWNAGLVLAGARGHLNGESGLGDWPQGMTLLRSLAVQAPPRRVACSALPAQPTIDHSEEH